MSKAEFSFGSLSSGKICGLDQVRHEVTDRQDQTDRRTTEEEEACSKASSLGLFLVLAKQQIRHVFFFICPCDEQKIENSFTK